MNKFKITQIAQDKQEAEWIVSAVSNGAKIDELYNIVFRPIVKYGGDDEQVKYYEEI
jgi:hypothetical protein